MSTRPNPPSKCAKVIATIAATAIAAADSAVATVAGSAAAEAVASVAAVVAASVAVGVAAAASAVIEKVATGLRAFRVTPMRRLQPQGKHNERRCDNPRAATIPPAPQDLPVLWR